MLSCRVCVRAYVLVVCSLLVVVRGVVCCVYQSMYYLIRLRLEVTGV